MRRRILFVTYGGGHVATLLPVIQELRNEFECQVLGLTNAEPVLKQVGTECLSLSPYLDEHTRRIGEQLAERMHAPDKGIPLESSIAYLGVSMGDLIAEVGEERARELLQEKGRHAFFPVRTLRRLLQDYEPDLVVATNSPRAEKAALVAAHQLGIPSLRVEQLFGEDRSGIEGPLPPVTRHACMHEYVKETLIRRGAQPDRVVVTGQPQFDMVLRRNPKAEAYLLQRIGAVEKPIVVVGTQPGISSATLEEVIATIRNMPQCKWVVKTHPSESSQRYESFFSALALKEISVIGHEPEHFYATDLLRLSSCLITEFSTLGLEAALMDRPVITLNMSGNIEPVPYAELGLAVRVTNRGSLGHVLRDILENGPIAQSLRETRRRWTTDGKATLRVVDLIRSMLS